MMTINLDFKLLMAINGSKKKSMVVGQRLVINQCTTGDWPLVALSMNDGVELGVKHRHCKGWWLVNGLAMAVITCWFLLISWVEPVVNLLVDEFLKLNNFTPDSTNDFNFTPSLLSFPGVRGLWRHEVLLQREDGSVAVGAPRRVGPTASGAAAQAAPGRRPTGPQEATRTKRTEERRHQGEEAGEDGKMLGAQGVKVWSKEFEM